MAGLGRAAQAAALMWPLLPFIIPENSNLTPKLGSTTLPCHWLRTRVTTLSSQGILLLARGSGSWVLLGSQALPKGCLGEVSTPGGGDGEIPAQNGVKDSC